MTAHDLFIFIEPGVAGFLYGLFTPWKIKDWRWWAGITTVMVVNGAALVGLGIVWP